MIGLLLALFAMPAQDLAMVEAMPVERLCTPEGTVGARFGEVGTPDDALFPGFDDLANLPPEFAPIRFPALYRSRWSGRLYRAEFPINLDDDAAVAPMLKRLGQRFRRAGWALISDPADEDLELVPESRASGSSARLSIARFGWGTVQITCSDSKLEAANEAEKQGILPDGAVRPQPSPGQRPETLDSAICASREGRARFDSAMKSHAEITWRYLEAPAAYWIRLGRWKWDRLRRSGAIPAERLARLKGPEIVGALRPDTFARDDDLPTCTDAVGLLLDYGEAEQQVVKMWQANNQELDAEAARVGISWE